MKEVSTIKDYMDLYKKAKNLKYDHSGLQDKNGIYFLIKKNKIVYIGMSKWSIKKRVEQHYNKDYDIVKYIELNYKDNIKLAEYVYINIFNPIYNKQNKNYEYQQLNK